MEYPMGNGKKTPKVVTKEFRGLSEKEGGGEGTFASCRNVTSDNYPYITTASDYQQEIDGYTNIQAVMMDYPGTTGFCGVADGVVYWNGEMAIVYDTKQDEQGNGPAVRYMNLSPSNEVQMFRLGSKLYYAEKKEDGRMVLYGLRISSSTKEARKGKMARRICCTGFAGWCYMGWFYDDNYDGWGVLYGFDDNDATYIKSLLSKGQEILVVGKDDFTKYMDRQEGEVGDAPYDAPVRCVVEQINGPAPDASCRKDENGKTLVSGNLRINIAFYNTKGVWADPFNYELDTRYSVGAGLFIGLPPQKVCWFEPHKNRVWTGRLDGSAVIGSAAWDGGNFYQFDGTDEDSVEIGVSTSGAFVGLKSYGESLLCFKRDSITVIYGDTPSNFSTGKDIIGVGCIDIRSCQSVDGILYFCAHDGFYAYSGGYPQFISKNLNARFEKCIAFTQEGKYYAEGTRADGECELLVYDTRSGIWLSEEAQGIRYAVSSGNKAYIVTENAVKSHNYSFEYKDREVDWFFESSDLLEGIFEKKGINEIFIRAKLEKGATMTVSTRDEDGSLTRHKTFTGDGKIKTYRVPVKFSKKEAYRYRVEGTGPAIIYEIERSVAPGGRAIKEG